MGFATLQDVKQYFGLVESEEHDELLIFLIKFYSEVIVEAANLQTIPATPSRKMTMALYYAIGCHLSRIDPSTVSKTTSYSVGNVDEEFRRYAGERSWCQDFENTLNDVIGEATSKFGAVAIKRKGLSDEYKNNI